MKIFNTEQIRAWDAYTIENEPIASVELMNRAAQAFADWFVSIYPDPQRPVVVVAGTGNNGGDGVAVARLLHWEMREVKVLVCDFGGKRSADFEAQFQKLICGGARQFVLDCSELDRISSAGLRTFLRVVRQLTNAGGRMTLHTLGETIERDIKSMGYATMLRLFPNEEEKEFIDDANFKLWKDALKRRDEEKGEGGGSGSKKEEKK